MSVNKRAQPGLVKIPSWALTITNKGAPFAMATQTVLPDQPSDNRSRLLCTLARQKAIKAVKRHFQDRAVRVACIPFCDIRSSADAYFAAHHQQLIHEALET